MCAGHRHSFRRGQGDKIDDGGGGGGGGRTGGWQIVREPEGNVWRDLELGTCETSKIRGRADDADCANFPTNGVRARTRAASDSGKD